MSVFFKTYGMYGRLGQWADKLDLGSSQLMLMSPGTNFYKLNSAYPSSLCQKNGVWAHFEHISKKLLIQFIQRPMTFLKWYLSRQLMNPRPNRDQTLSILFRFLSFLTCAKNVFASIACYLSLVWGATENVAAIISKQKSTPKMPFGLINEPTIFIRSPELISAHSRTSSAHELALQLSILPIPGGASP